MRDFQDIAGRAGYTGDPFESGVERVHHVSIDVDEMEVHGRLGRLGQNDRHVILKTAASEANAVEERCGGFLQRPGQRATLDFPSTGVLEQAVRRDEESAFEGS